MTDLLRVHDLNVRLPRPDGTRAHLLQGIHLRLDAGEAVGLVGPSGCGKSLTAHALCGLLPRGSVTVGTLTWRSSMGRAASSSRNPTPASPSSVPTVPTTPDLSRFSMKSVAPSGMAERCYTPSCQAAADSRARVASRTA